MKTTTRSITPLLLLAACGATQSPASPSSEAEGAISSSIDARRPCRDDLYFVEVPLESTPAWTNWRFLDQPFVTADLKGDLEAAATNLGGTPYGWFCTTSACRSELSASGVYAHLEPVLTRRTEAGRSDGHLRFLRLRFRRGSASAAVIAPLPTAQCDVVRTLRTRFAARAGVLASSFRTGRDCDALPMGAEGTPLYPAQYPGAINMLQWHLSRIGVDPAQVGLGVPGAGRDNIDVSLIDAGVSDPVASALGVATNWSAPDLASTSTAMHHHGAAMALLVRQVAPNARLHSFRMMEQDGHGTTRDLARAIDAAVYRETNRFRAQVLSLSLGFPSELAQPSTLQGVNACTVTEDGIGESVRYALDQARGVKPRAFHFLSSLQREIAFNVLHSTVCFSSRLRCRR